MIDTPFVQRSASKNVSQQEISVELLLTFIHRKMLAR